MKKILLVLLLIAAPFVTAANNADLIDPNIKLIKSIKTQGVDTFFVSWMIDVTAKHIDQYSGYGNKYHLAIPYYEKLNKKAPLFETYPKEIEAFSEKIELICRAAKLKYGRVGQTGESPQFKLVNPKKIKTPHHGACIDKNDRIHYVISIAAKRYQKLAVTLYSESDFIAFRRAEHTKLENLDSKKKVILAKFQNSLRIDYRTNYGQVLDIKHPIALIRYKNRKVWFRIEQLGPKGLF